MNAKNIRIAPALLAKYIEHLRKGPIMDKAPEDDDKPFIALMSESLVSKAR